jgi:hypothetical protein
LLVLAFAPAVQFPGPLTFANAWFAVPAVTSAFNRNPNVMDAESFLEAGTTPPTELAIEPSKTIFAIKLNT